MFPSCISVSFRYLGFVLVNLGTGLPCLGNLVNVYKSSNNRNDPVYTELPDLIVSLCSLVKSLIFLLEIQVRIFEIFILKVICFEKLFRGIQSECQVVWIQIRPDIL